MLVNYAENVHIYVYIYIYVCLYTSALCSHLCLQRCTWPFSQHWHYAPIQCSKGVVYLLNHSLEGARHVLHQSLQSWLPLILHSAADFPSFRSLIKALPIANISSLLLVHFLPPQERTVPLLPNLALMAMVFSPFL